MVVRSRLKRLGAFGTVVAACGALGVLGSSSASAGPAATVQQRAAAVVAPYLKAPKSIGVTKPLPKRPKKGLKIYVMDCGAPLCTAWADAVVQAGTKLGWSVSHVVQGVTPQAIQAAWTQVASQPSSGVLTIGIPLVLFSTQAQELESKHIPIINEEVADQAGGGVDGVIGGVTNGKLVGKLQAAFALSQLGAKADFLSVTSPDFPITGIYQTAALAEISSLCPTCKTSQLQVSAADLGTGANDTKIVAALQSNPAINYIITNDDIATGLTTALQTAGLAGKVSVVGEGAGPGDYQSIQSGTFYKGDVAFPPYEAGWQAVDALARLSEGVSLKPDLVDPPTQVLTPKNVKVSSAYYPYVANYQAQYEKLWHLK